MTEADLYPAVDRFLNIHYAPTLRPRLGEHLPIVEVTASMGVTGYGSWSRPDLAMINIWRHKYQPHQTLDLHGFEVKKHDSCDVRAVHETLAHTRLVHFAHLVWNYQSDDFEHAKYRIIHDNCADYGLGLITFKDMAQPDSFTVQLAPKRQTPTDAAVTDFIETCFTEIHKNRLLAWMRGRTPC